MRDPRAVWPRGPRLGEAPCPRASPMSQSAGPLPSCTVAVCDWPAWSVHPMVVLSPGWCPARDEDTSFEDVIVWPATEVITSPWVSPAWSAADPDTTPATVAPLAVEPT